MKKNEFNQIELTERVNDLISESNMTPRRFSKVVDIDSSNFSRKLLGKLPWTVHDINKISANLHVRKGWLVDGEGQKFKAPEEMLDKIPAQSSRTKAGEGIPLIPTNAMAGMLSGDDVQVMPYDIESYFVVPAFAKSDFCIRVDGKSMEPTYCKGDIIACKYVPMTDIWFQWGKVYVIATDQGVLVKHIEKGSDEEHIKLVSDNPEYMPFEIPTSGIYNIAVINGLIRVGDI